MKITPTRNVDNQLGDLESHDMTIKAGGKAFGVLVRGIYEDKVAAFVREITTNALDAHIQRGTPERPFRVDLPDSFDPYFRVRDYGVSMDHDTVVRIFGCLFESTKDDTNDVVGAWGIGSKSPLAYADSFEVTAFLDGVRRSYLVTIKADGTPVITLLSTEDSDEEQGIEVAVPILEHNFNAVRQAAQNILPGFDVMPEVIGAEIKPFDVLESVNDDEVRLVRRESTWGGMNVRVRMGCVLYPVSLRNIGFDYADEAKLNIGNCDLVINVNIGDVGITTNREALELTEDAKVMLKDMVLRANETLTAQVQAQFDACETRLEAVRKWHEQDMADWWDGNVQYNGKIVNEWLYIGTGKDARQADRDLTPFVRSEKKREITTLTQFRYGDVSSTRFVYGDTKQVKRATLRYREFCDEQFGKVYWLTNPTPKVMERMVRLGGFTADNFVWVGDLPDPGPVKRGERRKKGAGKPQGVYSATEGSYYTLPELDTMPDDFYWHEGSRVKRYHIRQQNEWYEAMLKDGADEIPFIVMTPSAVKRYKPKAERQIGTAYKAHLEANKVSLKAAYKRVMLHRRLPVGVDNILSPLEDADEVNAEAARHVLGFDERDTITTEADEQAEALKEQYPLLFSPDEATMRAYIASVDSDNADD
jgi:hypothetical protein